MWTVFGVVLLLELFLIFSTARLRQYLTKKFFRFVIGAGKVSVFLIRWGFILLFAAILLGGLYFKAPWKILVLDALLLALLTIVPKPKRKYGWLTLAAAVLAVTVWIFIPEKDTGDWRPYTFDEEVAALNAKYDVPEEENAAPYYEQIEVTDFYPDETFEDMFNFDREKRGPDLWDPNDDTMSRPWETEEFPELAAWLETEKEKIAPLWQAIQYDKCWFKVPTDPTTIDFEKLSDIKNALFVVQRMIYQDLAQDNLQGAVEKAMGILQCSCHFQQQSSLIDNLVGWALHAMADSIIRDIVINCSLDEASLTRLEAQIGRFENNWKSLIGRVLDYEQVYAKNIMGQLYEINERGDVRFTRKPDPLYLYSSRNLWGLDEDEKEPSPYWQDKKNKLERLIRWMTYAESPEDISEIYDQLYIQIRERLMNENFDYTGPVKWRDWLKYDLTAKTLTALYTEIAMTPFEKIQKIYFRCDTDKKATLIVIALLRFYNQHGHWPETLELIKKQLPDEVFVDSLNGQQIAYLRPENCDSFILYSFGEDGIDDKGFRGYAPRGPEKKKDDYLMWPRKENELKRMLGVEEPEEPEVDGEMMEMMF
jgi:hypothetical protein